VAAYDESGDGEDILEQGGGAASANGPTRSTRSTGPIGSRRRSLGVPRWLDALGRGLGADGGPGWRPSRGAALLAAVALVAGLGAGFAAGRDTSGGARPAAAPSASTTIIAPSTQVRVPVLGNPLSAPGPAVGQLIESCSTQTGTRLELGIEVSNTSSTAVTLTGVTPEYAITGGQLSEVSWRWGPCVTVRSGLDQPAISRGNVSLAPGATTWLSVTFDVHVRCPSGFPVGFDVRYAAGHVDVTAALPGFPEVSPVQYSGCSASGSAGSNSSSFSAVFFGPVGSPLTVHTLKRRLRRQGVPPGPAARPGR
jgi:hypothetical protein